MSLQTTASADAAARGIDWLASDGLPAGVEVDRHRIERVHGRGGMAIVYEATQLLLQRRVALKLLSGSPSGEMELQMRFWQEALLQANLSHPNIVEVYEVGTAHAGAYITMRLIRGQSLTAALRAGMLSPETIVDLLAPVADALDHAHGAGLVHRDVKPQNLN